MSTIKIIDTTLRDGQQSLWACRMRPSAMLPALPDMDDAGFEAMEFILPSNMFRRTATELHEHPWDWLRLGTARVQHTELRLHGGARSPFSDVPPSVQRLLLDKLVALGITVTRTSNPWNNYEDFLPVQAGLAEHGIRTVANLIYSVSPRHTLDYFAQKAKEVAATKPYRICFKDVGGLLTPESAAEVIPIIVENVGDIPLEFHAHSNNGFAPYICLIAAEHGIDSIHVAIPPLANGASQPSVFTVVRNLRARGFEVDVDLDLLERVSEHFFTVAEIEDLPVGSPSEFEEYQYFHQVPGGMISNLQFQMEQIGQAHRLGEALEEAAAVRKDLGYPIMVTPLSQFVGSQAVLNVITGERYGTVTDQVIRYCLGEFGRDAITEMDGTVREMILRRPRARELEEKIVDDPSLEEVRERFGGDISDEDLLVRVLAGLDPSIPLGEHQAIEAPTYEDYLASRDPLKAALAAVSGASSRVSRFEYVGSKGEVFLQRSR